MAEFALSGPGGADPYSQDPSLQRAQTPMWREMFAGMDLISLGLSPTYLGCGISRGHGEPVVIIPGFMGSDGYLAILFDWLARMGYRPYFSDIGVAADCPDHLSRLLLDTVRRAHTETGHKVRLIGHSLGGMLARTIALDYPEIVSGVISMGTPFRESVQAHPSILTTIDALRNNRGRGGVGRNMRPSCFSGHCTCNFVKNMLAPEQYTVPHFAIYSRTDGVVGWESCIEEDPALNDEVRSTHVGMAFNPAVYRVLGRRLPQMA